MTTLTTDAKSRKAIPIATGFIDYFPDAIAAVAQLSQIGNDQHNPGKSLFWDRSKSGDESDCLMRHFLERGTIDTDGVKHSTKVAWRALAMLQKEIENDRAREIERQGQETTTPKEPGHKGFDATQISPEVEVLLLLDRLGTWPSLRS